MPTPAAACAARSFSLAKAQADVRVQPASACNAVSVPSRHGSATVIAKQAIVGQAFDRREIAVRCIRGAETPDMAGHRAQLDADAIPRRQIRRRGMHQAGVEQQHRSCRPLWRDDAAALDQARDRRMIDRPQR
jgi:hypothetical protein